MAAKPSVTTDKTESDLTEVTGLCSTADSSTLQIDSTHQEDQLGNAVWDSTLQGDPDTGFGGVFDVAKLLDSLQQLNRTQGELQATADKLRSLPLMVAAESASLESSACDDDVIKPGVSIKEECSVSAAPGGGRSGGVELSISGLSSSSSSLPTQQVTPAMLNQQEGSSVRQNTMLPFGKGSSTQQNHTSISRAKPPTPPVGVRQAWDMQGAMQGANGSPPAVVVKRKVAFDVSVIAQDTSTDSDHGSSIGVDPITPTSSAGGGLDILLDKKRKESLGKPRKLVRKGEEESTWFSLASHLA